jgi:hypothetical protein
LATRRDKSPGESICLNAAFFYFYFFVKATMFSVELTKNQSLVLLPPLALILTNHLSQLVSQTKNGVSCVKKLSKLIHPSPRLINAVVFVL